MSLLSKRLLIVTGKGGVGKSTVAAALGVAAAAGGRRTLIVEVAGQHRILRLFGARVRDERPQPVRPNLEVASIEPQQALERYLTDQIRLRAVAQLLLENRIVTYFAAAAPGLRELVTLSAIRAFVEGPHDLVIVDAPATGHGLGFLSVPRTFVELARVGPVRDRAAAVATLLEDPAATAVVLVATPDDLAVLETLEALEQLAEGRVSCAGLIANAVYPPLFRPGDEEALCAVGDDAAPTARAAVRAARSRIGRAAAQSNQLARLPPPLASLPFLFSERVGTGEIAELASLLEDV